MLLALIINNDVFKSLTSYCLICSIEFVSLLSFNFIVFMENSIKLFISYSWTNQDHETWVLNLAKELVENGVHVIIDKWDLKEGQDSYSFMEKWLAIQRFRKS